MSAEKLTLIKGSGNRLFAISWDGEFMGKLTNSTCSSDIVIDPSKEEQTDFDKIYGGHGCILEVCEKPPNGFFKKSWDEVFNNPELLPPGTKSLFLDTDFDSCSDWNVFVFEKFGLQRKSFGEPVKYDSNLLEIGGIL